MKAMAETLWQILTPFLFQKPKGGMFIYGRLPGIDTGRLVKQSLKRGVAFVPGEAFYLGTGPRDEMRFSYTHASAAQMQKGIRIISKYLEYREADALII